MQKLRNDSALLAKLTIKLGPRTFQPPLVHGYKSKNKDLPVQVEHLRQITACHVCDATGGKAIPASTNGRLTSMVLDPPAY
jgi:hypothetical protein